MVRVFVRHPVSDFNTWKEHFEAFVAEAKGMGVMGHAVYQAVGDPNDVTVTNDFADAASADAFLGSPRLKEVMGAAGVAGPPSIWLTTPA
jgi:quinol monooxygenase YgiN